MRWSGSVKAVFAIGPRRSSDQIVEQAFDWTADERRQVEQRLNTALRGDRTGEDVTALLDGVVPVWRAAVRTHRGLLGAHLIPS